MDTDQSTRSLISKKRLKEEGQFPETMANNRRNRLLKATTANRRKCLLLRNGNPLNREKTRFHMKKVLTVITRRGTIATPRVAVESCGIRIGKIHGTIPDRKSSNRVLKTIHASRTPHNNRRRNQGRQIIHIHTTMIARKNRRSRPLSPCRPLHGQRSEKRGPWKRLLRGGKHRNLIAINLIFETKSRG